MADSCKLIQSLLVDGEAASACECAAISPNSKKIFLAARDTSAHVWAAGKPQSLLTLSGHTSKVTSVGFHPNETYVGGGATDGSLKIWDLQQGGKVARTLAADDEAGQAIRTTLFHPLGADMVVTGSATNFVSVWNYRTRSRLKKLDACVLPQSTVAKYQSDAPQVEMTEEILAARRTALNVARQRSEQRAQVNTGPVLQFSPNGRWLLYAPALTAEDVAVAAELHSLTGGAAMSASMHGLMFSYVHIWDMTSGEEIAALEHNSSEGSVTSYAFHPQELILATSTSAGVLRIWDLEKNFTEIAQLQCGHSDKATAAGSTVLFAPDGKEMICLYRAGSESWMDRLSFSPSTHSVTAIGSARVGWVKLLAVSHFQESSLIAIEAKASPALWLVNSKCTVEQANTSRRESSAGSTSKPQVADQTAEMERAAKLKAAEQKAAEQKAAEQKAAEQKAAEQKAAEQKAAELKAAEQKAAELKAVRQAKKDAKKQTVAARKASRSPELPEPKPLAPVPSTRTRKRSKSCKEPATAAQKATATSKTQMFVYSDRTNAVEHLDFADFLPSGMSVDPLRQKSVSEITAELFTPTVHKKFCSTLFGRLGALKGLRAQAQRGEWAGVLDTAVRSKEKDAVLTANLFEGVLGYGLPVIKSKHIVYQPVESPFQPEQCRDLMQLLQQLLSSKNPNNAIVGMLMLQRTTLSCSKATLKSSLCFQYFNIVMRQVHKIRKMSSTDDSSSKRHLQALAKLVSTTYRDSIA